MAVIGQTMPPDLIKKLFLPVLQTMAKDKVANIRMNVAKTVQSLNQKVSSQADIQVSD